MTESIANFWRDNGGLVAIVAVIVGAVVLILCGCASPILASRNVSVYINGGTNTMWITSEPAGGASVLSGVPTNAIEAFAHGAAEGATAVK